MGKITKPLQPKHKDTLSPWLKDFVQAAVSTPLPLIPKKLDEFPTRWPFPRGDLYHWIPLLNRFDNILECLSRVYGLSDGPQVRDFQCDILLKKVPEVEYYDDHSWDRPQLEDLGYKEDGDLRLLVAILEFTCMLLQHCGNRSIYASSSHLNDLLQSTSLHVLVATLQVGHQLAQRYQASVKRVSVASRQLSVALLANHYNIDLDRVQTLAQPFVKTPIVNIAADPFPATPSTSAIKGKDKVPVVAAKNVATTTANDLVSVTQDQPEEGRWNGWGDVKVLYYTTPAAGQESSVSQPAERSTSSMPSTPTPLRRSNTAGPQHRTPRGERSDGLGEDASSPASQGRSPAVGADSASSNQHQVNLPQNAVANTPIYDLLSRCPSDMPSSSRYEVLNRLRVSKALLGTPETRQLALAVRLLAITNMAYIHPEVQFIEKALKCDNDEPRRYQLAYQLVELIHPSTVGASPTPLWLQSIALQLLEGICGYATKYTDVLSALNANVNHGVLLYVIRKAVAEIKENTDDNGNRHTDADEWRSSLFSLALNMAQTGRAGGDAISSGMMEIMVEILKLRSSTAQRHQPMVLSFLDNVTWAYPGAFQAFVTADGLTGVSQLIIDTTAIATSLTEEGKGTSATAQSVVVDYEIPYYQQQTLKWLLKFSHHIMTNSFTYGGNIDRLLRNLVDNSQLLQSLRTIVQHVNKFGSVVWTHAVTILGDFINNDPTSFNAILESGTIHTFLESLTGQKIVMEQPKEREATPAEPENPEESPSSPPSDGSVVLEDDERNHPPTNKELNAPRTGPLARGILPSAEAMSIIPNILNALSLNNTGMTMVAKSRVFDTYLEIFESPAHVRCMVADAEIPANIGATFDELARHHPALRTALSNAVLDLVAKIKHLGQTKAASSGWGVKLRLTQGGSSSKGKGKENAGDDIVMVDAEQATSSDAAPTHANDTAIIEAEEEGITSHISVLLNFLHAFLGNNNLKSSFVTSGGTELVLDLCQSPSLGFDFLESAAARTMQNVVSQLIEQAPVLGLPSLLNRTQAAIEALQPLLSTTKGDSYFAAFLVQQDAPSHSDVLDDARSKYAEATRIVQGLLHAQSFIKILWQTFPTPPRPGHSGLHPVNVFDYYIGLVKTLGPLLRVILVEEVALAHNVPRHWSKKLFTAQDRGRESEDPAPGSSTPAAAAGDAARSSSLQEVLQLVPGSGPEEDVSRTKKITPEEQSLEAYRNFQTLDGLLHSFMPTTFPFFQTLGRVLLPRRDRDPYVRSRHLQIADTLAEIMFDHLLIHEAPTTNDYHYLIVMLHALHQMLIDHPKGGSPTAHIIIPVLLAFKERGGLDALNKLLLDFTSEINKDPDAGGDTTRSKLAALGAKKILELYSIIVNGKNISGSNDHVTMHRSADRGDSAKFIPQLVLELRMAILPTVRGIWASGNVEKLSTSILSKVVEILRIIAAADVETGALRKTDTTPPPTLFKLQSTPFNWFSCSNVVTQLTELNGDEQLSREATYRALGERERAVDYSRAHGPRHLAGARNPVPEEDAYKGPPRSDNASRNEASAVPSDAMVLDSTPELDRLLGEAVLGELDHSDSDDDDQDAEDAEATAAQPEIPTEEAAEQAAAEPAGQSSEVENKDIKSYIYREDLDEERAKIQEDLIDRCLDVIRAHPDSVYELSDLISTTVLKSAHGDSRQEVGETLVNALMSFAIDEEVKKSSAHSIAAYAHLLCILLQNSQPFFRDTISSLKDNISETMDFLKLPPGNSSEELPPWLPYILLIFEILLTEDQQLPETTWKGPKSETDDVEPVILGSKDIFVNQQDRATLLETILDILPRIGKDEMLAVAVLRILVILTRDRSVARTVGDKKNLQRLFVMAKQLSGAGSARFKETHIGAHIMLILRHIVEDDDTLRQIMRYEIKSHFENPRSGSRQNDVITYLRATSHIALRAPDLFVAVTNDMVKFAAQWAPDLGESARSSPGLVLKESASSTATAPKPPKDDSVEPAVQGTEDLNINDVRPSTEAVDKEMVDVPKTPAFEHKRPIVENPDGVINFLLEQLLNYQRVEDAEVPQQPKEVKSPDVSTVSTPAGPTASGAVVAEAEGAQSKDKDKKQSKPSFKADEHPIFIYRCFLLSCLTELLQGYNRTKMEFINFKRGAVLQTNTPIKPRSSVLNYLLNDLLCISSLTSPADTIAAKKKAATAEQARFALSALVTKTSEKPIDRSKDRFEYDDEPDLLFVRRFVLDMILRAYKDAATSNEAFDVRYAKMLSIAELMNHMIGEKDRESTQSQRMPDSSNARSQMQLKRLMYEKGYLGALTTSIADIDLTFPGVKRTIKYILRVLRVLSNTAIYLSRSSVILTASVEDPEDDVLSNSSLSDMTDDREETPDLYRNSALGMLEPHEDDYHNGSEDDDDEEMYEDEYDDEMDYGEAMSEDGEEDISDEDEDLGEIEGLSGDPGVVEVIMGEDEDESMHDDDEDEDDEDEDSDDDDSDDDEDDDEVGSEDMDVLEEQLDMMGAGAEVLDDGWEDEASDEEADDGEGPDFEAVAQELDDVRIHGGIGDGDLGRFENVVRAMGEGIDFEPDDEHIQRFEEHYLEEVGEEDDDEDDDNEIEDEEFVYDPRDGPPPPHMPPGLGWDSLVAVDAGGGNHRHRHGGIRSPFPPFVFGRGDPMNDFRSFFGPRHGRSAPSPNAPDDGVNPLLRRVNASGRDSSPRPTHGGLLRVGMPSGLLSGNIDSPMAFLNDFVASLPNMRQGDALHFQITHQGPRGEIRELNIPFGSNPARDSRTESRRDLYQEPHQAVAFAAQSTYDRWLDEARIIFGPTQPEKIVKALSNRIMALLTPAALELARENKAIKEEREKKLREEREKLQEEERKIREAKEAEEKAEREKKEAEEKERLELEAAEAAQAAEAAARAAEEAPPEAESEAQEPQPMEGVETSGSGELEQPAPAAEDSTRIMTTIRGEAIDVTDLGIDPDYLAALPEEFREEVITGTLTARRSEARAQVNTGDQSDILNEFLAALPEDMRLEIVQHERQENRRREREETQRAAAASGQAAMAQEMDAGSILATLDADLRNQILMEQGEELLDHLPPDMAAQAAAFRERHRPRPPPGMARAAREPAIRVPAPAVADNKVERRAVVQMLDKAGIATLLRLMFITQHGSIRNYLFSVFTDVCENRQNRIEVVSTLLQILQEGSTDMDAVERSFGQLSLKARQPREKEGKTPNSLKRTFTNISASASAAPTSDISPLLIVQQCLDLLVELSTKNLHIPSLFLTEHEVVGSTLKRAFNKKGKGKDNKASKYAINSLLSLLDRGLIMESSSVMQLLVDLLNKVTYPLQALERRRKEAIEEEKKDSEKKDEPPTEPASAEQATTTTADEGQPQAAAEPEASASGESATAEAATQTEATSSTAAAQDTKALEKKKARQLQPPVIPFQNLTLVVNIFVARECSSKTFQNTISTIKNLSNIPDAKQVFGQELVRQARNLSENIVSDLNELLPHILKAETGTEIQGIALAKFSPGASEQNKLLRVLTALDHLFDSKKKPENEAPEVTENEADKFDFLSSLGHNSTFGIMWEKLSACLGAIRKRENMLNVATILLPLIESLMVVCKNTTSLSEVPTTLGQGQALKDMFLSSPAPEDRISGLFFSFTEEHRRILNELVRHNPKLMSGTFSLLVKNPKVLEFDNKRNYFNRSVHAKVNNQGRSSFAPLQLSVRREQVFHDSFKSLYFKSGDEMKYGKLSIRFHGEEGVDAGGVSREWFQVLARQMFDPNYVLFTPVSSDRTTFHPNKLSAINDEHLMFFKFIGRVIGKALYEGRLLDCYFSRVVYKRILGKPVSVKDMESFDPDYYKSLVWMLENDIADIITETFSVEDDQFGVTTIVDLCPNGRDVAVTEDNKHEYVRLVVEHKLLNSVKEQMAHFLKGFHDVIPADLIAIFNEQELELLISGLPDIDIEDWKSTTEYHNYTAASPQIQWFWRAVRSFDKEERAKLLQFVTGTSKVPLNGFKELEGMNGVSRFNIHRDYGNKERLPSSHTCFNQLDLPEYESYDMLRAQVMQAITAGNDYFGFA